jgi:hypothetical protein
VEQWSGSCQSGTRDSRDGNMGCLDLNVGGHGGSTEVEEVSSSIDCTTKVRGANDVFWEQYLTEEPETPTDRDSDANHQQETENRAWEDYSGAPVGSSRDDSRSPQAQKLWDCKPSVDLLSHKMGQLAPG